MANLARDAEGRLSYLATSEWRLGDCMEHWPDIAFFKASDIN
jgi:peptide chain release factor 3